MGKRLQGKVAVITGAGRGIGRVTALLFAKEGAKLTLVDNDESSVASTAQEIKGQGGIAAAVVCDIANKPDITSAMQSAVREQGALHILVNNAGITLTRPFVDTASEEIDALVSVNLKGTIFASQAAIPHIITAGGGAIVHEASNAGLVGRPWQSVYGATKAGLISLTKSMALSFAKNNIRVNCICPGSIDTPMLRTALSSSGDFDENWRKTEMVIPMGRIGAAEDIANATLFLASDEASYITGVALPVDGGRTAGVAEVSHLGMTVPRTISGGTVQREK
jgi:NAD(P)-dependent dehydrogenase (short-subunit alcohol dehydrogenase family)